MALNKDEILELMNKAKELGAAKVEVDGFKVDFNSENTPAKVVQVKPVVDSKLEDIFKPAPDDPINDEELVLYYATPYYDELMAEREQKANHAKEAKNLKEPSND